MKNPHEYLVPWAPGMLVLGSDSRFFYAVAPMAHMRWLAAATTQAIRRAMAR